MWLPHVVGGQRAAQMEPLGSVVCSGAGRCDGECVCDFKPGVCVSVWAFKASMEIPSNYFKGEQIFKIFFYFKIFILFKVLHIEVHISPPHLPPPPPIDLLPAGEQILIEAILQKYSILMYHYFDNIFFLGGEGLREVQLCVTSPNNGHTHMTLLL